ncbi:hypothetical protein WCD74_27070 [Actinomycetospora sp. OC33-EN08]|uniref:Cupin domain-containing protein n=1 Tax=Actinomycetospora aurantiaca TaxID=3129233 RepID=A0ABU8MVW8_9PSEU
MKIRKEDIAATIDVPGAIARQRQDFGEASGYGTIAGEYFSLGAGTDIAPLLAGLPGDSCHAPHWGYMLEGSLTVSYTNGTTEDVEGGELFYWPPGHSVRVERDSEVILFSPAQEHNDVIDHMKSQMGV